ncbi:hypothetical protein DL93DRAFT_500645 [Clavulina sp. PMI_390]|nr:hypothetical protein DL93DRAFT_500645 [Clavulina sp. PMI_390]
MICSVFLHSISSSARARALMLTFSLFALTDGYNIQDNHFIQISMVRVGLLFRPICRRVKDIPAPNLRLNDRAYVPSRRILDYRDRWSLLDLVPQLPCTTSTSWWPRATTYVRKTRNSKCNCLSCVYAPSGAFLCDVASFS